MINVLIIGDDDNSTDMLKMTLETFGFKALIATSMSQGIDLALKQHLDVIILDFIIPMLDGANICQAIRKFTQVPILVLSIIDQPTVVAQVLDAGADDYLVKPVPVNILYADLNKLSRKPGTGSLSAHSLPFHLS